jgi:hypothetical protein
MQRKSNNIDMCLLCLDELSPPLQKPSSCNCNVYLHKKCMEEIRENGLLCPICRIKGAAKKDENIFNCRPSVLMFLFFFVWFTIATCVACIILVGVSVILFACLFFIELPSRCLYICLQRALEHQDE